MTKYVPYIMFCVEHYKAAKGLSGQATWKLFEDNDVLSFIRNAYEALHTQSKNLTIVDIDNYIANKTFTK
jgi:hypothetical protein